MYMQLPLTSIGLFPCVSEIKVWHRKWTIDRCIVCLKAWKTEPKSSYVFAVVLLHRLWRVTSGQFYRGADFHHQRSKWGAQFSGKFGSYYFKVDPPKWSYPESKSCFCQKQAFKLLVCLLRAFTACCTWHSEPWSLVYLPCLSLFPIPRSSDISTFLNGGWCRGSSCEMRLAGKERPRVTCVLQR